MAPTTPRLKILSVGGNPVSAFLSWRLQATNACDVSLVWKSGYEHVAQYGISFRSTAFGNERFKPRHVVKTPEEAASRREGAFDYVILCIKALPDVYDLASVIDSVVTPQHTCILINTTNTLGVESAIEERFPTNVVLSLVSGAEVSQLGQSEFEHKGSTEVWVGPANKNDNIPRSIQEDMAQALAMTLSTGQVDCKVSPNIRQQQFERVIGPIAFHPASVIFETPNHAALLEKVGVLPMVTDIIDELLVLAEAQGCKLPPDFKQKTIGEMTKPSAPESIMWQDYMARRPMEVETYLGSPMKLAQQCRVRLPRIETLYAILHNLNNVNRQKPRVDLAAPPAPSSPMATPSPLSRMSSQPMMQGPPGGGGGGGMLNGNGMPRRPRGSSSLGPPPGGMRRGPGPNNGGGHGRPSIGGPVNGFATPRQPSRRGSMEGGADLEEFSHLVVYDDAPETASLYSPDNDMALRERELQLRQRELALREREMQMRRGPPAPPPPPSSSRMRGPSRMRTGGPGAYNNNNDDDDDEDDDYFDPGPSTGPPIDADNFDMMSVTSRKNRRAPNAAQLRQNPEYDPAPARSSRFRPSFGGRNRSSHQMVVGQAPGIHDNILDDPLMSCSSNRYANVDRSQMHESRTNSLTAARLDELQYNHQGGPPPMTGMNGPFPRRASQSPGHPYNNNNNSPSIRGGPPPGPPINGFGGGSPMNGRPSPPDAMRQPVPRYPPGHGNVVAPQQVEQHVGVSALQPPKAKNVRSLTGSASASAGSGDSEPSAHSSQSSLGPHAPIGVR